jgi:hypothetical protein
MMSTAPAPRRLLLAGWTSWQAAAFVPFAQVR